MSQDMWRSSYLLLIRLPEVEGTDKVFMVPLHDWLHVSRECPHEVQSWTLKKVEEAVAHWIQTAFDDRMEKFLWAGLSLDRAYFVEMGQGYLRRVQPCMEVTCVDVFRVKSPLGWAKRDGDDALHLISEDCSRLRFSSLRMSKEDARNLREEFRHARYVLEPYKHGGVLYVPKNELRHAFSLTDLESILEESIAFAEDGLIATGVSQVEDGLTKRRVYEMEGNVEVSVEYDPRTKKPFQFSFTLKKGGWDDLYQYASDWNVLMNRVRESQGIQPVEGRFAEPVTTLEEG
jgi:hypothetical protein